jgi:8-oxo-dGTP pyrophosphatase MutT (NUDIX family)
MTAPGPEEVRAALAAHRPQDWPALPGRTNHLQAGVLVPLVWDPEPYAVLTERPHTLRRHAGEVCFPGGRPEPEDESIAATALREAWEELGIPEAEILGRLSSMPLYTSDYRLVPFVASVPAAPMKPDPAEVAAVLRAPLAGILGWPRIDAIPYTLSGRSHLSPVFFLEGRSVYGATAHTLLELLEVLAPLFGAAVPPLVPGRLDWHDVMVRR